MLVPIAASDAAGPSPYLRSGRVGRGGHARESACARARMHEQRACVRVQEVVLCRSLSLYAPYFIAVVLGLGILGHNRRKLEQQRRREQHKTEDRVAYWLIVRSRSGHIFMHTIGDTIDSTIWSSRNELEWILLIVVLWS